MERAQKEKLKRIARRSAPVVLGAVTVKNIYDRHVTRHISYWEASRSLIMDLMEEGGKTIRVSGTLRLKRDGSGVAGIVLDESREYTDEEVERLEAAFPGDESATS